MSSVPQFDHFVIQLHSPLFKMNNSQCCLHLIPFMTVFYPQFHEVYFEHSPGPCAENVPINQLDVKSRTHYHSLDNLYFWAVVFHFYIMPTLKPSWNLDGHDLYSSRYYNYLMIQLYVFMFFIYYMCCCVHMYFLPKNWGKDPIRMCWFKELFPNIPGSLKRRHFVPLLDQFKKWWIVQLNRLTMLLPISFALGVIKTGQNVLISSRAKVSWCTRFIKMYAWLAVFGI